MTELESRMEAALDRARAKEKHYKYPMGFWFKLGYKACEKYYQDKIEAQKEK